MIKSSFAPVLCFCLLAAALPSALSAPAKNSGEAALSDKMFSGITQVSFTRRYPEYDSARGWEHETVTFSLTNFVATRVLTASSPNDTVEEPIVRFQGNVEGLDYMQLTHLLASDKFFEGSNRYVGYVNGRSGIGYALSPFITIRAIRNGTPKTVTMDANPPTQMWALQAALRGLASDVVWHKVEKTADAGGVKPH